MYKPKELWERILKSRAQQVMSITSVGMGFMLLLDILIAARFGTTEIADALIIALLLPLFFDTVARESTKFSLVPIFINYYDENDSATYNRFVSGLINLLVILAVMIGLGILFFSTQIVNIIGPGLTEEAVLTSSGILNALIPLIIVLPVISILSVALNSIKKFNSVALRNLIIPVLVIISMVLGWQSEETYLFVAAGYSLGYVMYGFVLWKVSNINGYRYQWKSLSTKADLKKINSAISWPTFGFIVRQGGRIAEKSIASLIGIGGVASYYYGFRIFSAIQTIVGTSVATTSLPDLSKKKNLNEFKKLLRNRLRIILYIAIPIALLLAFFSEQIVQVILSRGHFDLGSIERTSTVLFWLSFGIIFMCIGPVLNSGLYAKERYKTVFLNTVFLACLNVITGFIFSKLWGLAGLAVSVSLTALVSVGILLFLNFKFQSE